MIRYETRDEFDATNETDNTFDKDPVITVNDYNIGVSYKINKNTAKCTVQSISAGTFDADQNFTQSLIDAGDYAIRLRSPQSLLQLDTDYIYTGQRRINGIDANVFISKKSVGKINFVNEYAFPSVNLN